MANAADIIDEMEHVGTTASKAANAADIIDEMRRSIWTPPPRRRQQIWQISILPQAPAVAGADQKEKPKSGSAKTINQQTSDGSAKTINQQTSAGPAKTINEKTSAGSAKTINQQTPIRRRPSINRLIGENTKLADFRRP
ncbi:hypothetical protein KC360_g6871 [Hortaea werneckii]|nr:hypothetical protein KC325_g6883 [Hortaea werneckii]KAI7000483.1 hypothetical protein KC359_g1145 [Hortaea werneckii]KAI7142072.1 hypothetical protein KC344_g7506 [Hortaea werneckii]KAI7170385.1 hypothetical protein KC360_g6871 [Hortaea werneckii]